MWHSGHGCSRDYATHAAVLQQSRATAALAASPLRVLEGPGLLHRVVELLSGHEDALFFALVCRACRDAVWADARFPLVRGKRSRVALVLTHVILTTPSSCIIR